VGTITNPRLDRIAPGTEEARKTEAAEKKQKKQEDEPKDEEQEEQDKHEKQGGNCYTLSLGPRYRMHYLKHRQRPVVHGQSGPASRTAGLGQSEAKTTQKDLGELCTTDDGTSAATGSGNGSGSVSENGESDSGDGKLDQKQDELKLLREETKGSNMDSDVMRAAVHKDADPVLMTISLQQQQMMAAQQQLQQTEQQRSQQLQDFIQIVDCKMEKMQQQQQGMDSKLVGVQADQRAQADEMSAMRAQADEISAMNAQLAKPRYLYLPPKHLQLFNGPGAAL